MLAIGDGNSGYRQWLSVHLPGDRVLEDLAKTTENCIAWRENGFAGLPTGSANVIVPRGYVLRGGAGNKQRQKSGQENHREQRDEAEHPGRLHSGEIRTSPVLRQQTLSHKSLP